MPGSEYLHCFFPLPPLRIINQCAFSPFSRPTTSQTSIVRLAYEAKSKIIISLTLKCIQIYFEGNNFVLHPLHVGLFFDFKHIADAFKGWLASAKLRSLVEIILARPIRGQDFNFSFNVIFLSTTDVNYVGHEVNSRPALQDVDQHV